MVDRFKITYLDACPYSYSAMLFKNIKQIMQDRPESVEIALYNSDERKLRLLSQYLYNATRKSNKKNLSDVIISTYNQEEEALQDADFVIQAISADNYQTELYDYFLPLKFGIVHTDGNQIGPAGIFKSFRTNFLTVATAQKIKKICPKAPFLILSNPQATNILATRQKVPSVMAFGMSTDLDQGTIPIQNLIQTHPNFEKNPDFEYYFEYAGIPQCSWLTKIKYGGNDYTDLLQAHANTRKSNKFKQQGFNFYLYNTLGSYCYADSNSIGEYFPQFVNYFNLNESFPKWKFTLKPRKEQRKLISSLKLTLKKLFPHPILYSFRKGYRVPKALELAMNYNNNNSEIYPGICLNQFSEEAIIQNLSEDSIVEVPMRFKDKEIQPVDQISLSDEIINILTPYSESQQYTVEASLGNQLDLTVQAMLQDPMNQWIDDDDKITYLTHLMLYYEQDFLPQAWKEWIPSKEELQKSKWWISSTDLTKENGQYLKFKFPVKEERRSHAFFWTKEAIPKELPENED